nr:putative wax ester synthase/acyl-CoA:diacylglycerol acyltransferase [uncultured bacterium]
MADLVYESRMSDSDALMWTMEKDAMLRSTITAVSVLDRAPDHDRLRTLLDRGTRVVPRLRQRVRANPLSIAPPRWEVDPNFDLDYHVRFSRVTGDGSMRDVLDMAQPIAMTGFDRARPLWEATLIEGMEGGRAALVMKVHHAITDGVGSVKLALIMFELERDPSIAALPDAPDAQVMTQASRWMDAIAHEQRRVMGIARRSGSTLAGATTRTASDTLGDPGGALSRAVETVASVGRLVSPATEPLSPVMTGRSLSVHFDHLVVPMDAAKAAAKAAGATLNDAFVAATAGGFARYHQEMGLPTDALRMTMPISIRNDATQDQAGNQFVPARFPIPLDEHDPSRRMQLLHDLLLSQRGEPALGLVEPLAGLLRRLPTSLSTGIFGSMLKGVDLITSNVPGAPIPIFTAGGRVESMFALGPLTGAAANLTLLSYLDDLHIGVNVDPAAVTEPARLVDALREAWDEVLAVGSPSAAPTRNGSATATTGRPEAEKRTAKKRTATKTRATKTRATKTRATKTGARKKAASSKTGARKKAASSMKRTSAVRKRASPAKKPATTRKAPAKKRGARK